MIDTKDGNKIIAEFMRGKKSPPNWTWEYHESWNSLIPENSSFYLFAPNLTTDTKSYSFVMLPDTDKQIRKNGDNFFEMVYDSVVEYLKTKSN